MELLGSRKSVRPHGGRSRPLKRPGRSREVRQSEDSGCTSVNSKGQQGAQGGAAASPVRHLHLEGVAALEATSQSLPGHRDVKDPDRTLGSASPEAARHLGSIPT